MGVCGPVWPARGPRFLFSSLASTGGCLAQLNTVTAGYCGRMGTCIAWLHGGDQVTRMNGPYTSPPPLKRRFSKVNVAVEPIPGPSLWKMFVPMIRGSPSPAKHSPATLPPDAAPRPRASRRAKSTALRCRRPATRTIHPTMLDNDAGKGRRRDSPSSNGAAGASMNEWRLTDS